MSRYLETNKEAVAPPPPLPIETLRYSHTAKRVAWSVVTAIVALGVAGTIGYSLMG